MLSDEFEWFAMDLQGEKQKKWGKTYKSKIDWVLRDIITSTANGDHYRAMMQDLNDEHAKDLQVFLDMGISCGNLSEVIEVLEAARVKPDQDLPVG